MMINNQDTRYNNQIMTNNQIINNQTEKTETDNATKHDTDTHNENGWLKLDNWDLFNCLIVIFTLSWLWVLGGVVFAMGEIPTTTTVVKPTVEYVREFGLPGTGERQFYFPKDVKVSVIGDLETGLGNIFVADTGNNRIQRLDEEGNFLYQFGGFGTDLGKFNSPDGLAIDFNYRLYVSEKDNDRVQLFDIRGNFLSLFATGEYNYKSIQDPAGMDVDALGNVYLADSGNDRILVFDASGNFLLEAGGFGAGMGFLNHPMDVASDRDRTFYVADMGNSRIQKFDYDGRPLLSFGSAEEKLLAPSGVAVDDHFVYVSDTGNHRICLFTKQGEFVLAFGSKGSGKGEFNGPAGISLGKKGQLYVADSLNHRIVELRVRY